MISAKLRDAIFHPKIFEYRSAYINSIKRPLGRPIDVTMELSSECNGRCVYCYWSEPKNLPFTPGIMSFETAKQIIEGAADADAYSMKFNHRGESTINPNFAEIIKYSRSFARGKVLMERFTNTNFKFRTNRLDIFDGFCAMTKVKVSYDSFNKGVFESQRHNIDHDLVTENIDRFYHWPGRETEIALQAVRTKANFDEDFVGLAKKRWPKVTVSIRDAVGGRVDRDLSGVVVKNRDASERQSCIQAHTRLIFAWDGIAGPCCPDISKSLILGDIKKESVMDIWNGFRARRLRESLIDKSAFEKDPCKNCSSFETFKSFQPNWTS